MRFPWVNLSLLFLVVLQLVTGFAGLFGASSQYRAFFWAHAVGAYAIIAILSAKAIVVRDAVHRRPGVTADRVMAGVLAFLLIAVLATALVWITSGRRFILGLSLINVHAVLAVALLAMLVWHVLGRRWIVRVPAAADRRAFLRLSGALAAGFVLWQTERVVARLLDLPGSRRRFTGSYEVASLSPDFPSTSWLDDDPEPVDPSVWRLVVEGAVEHPLSLGYDEMERMASTSVAATIDCTGGWYSRQEWKGVALAHLLARAGLHDDARSVSVESVTGYGRRFSLDRAGDLILATRVAGQALGHGHGFPMRLVVPDRRGFEWVKWVTRVRVLESSPLLQPPLPLT
jgi:DMSO/TMAO reductase YedYZ molybdopterin-dependent catalytic subunit